MRLNRGTLTILVASIVVIIAVALISNPASAPDTTPTPMSSTPEPIFAAVDQTTITRFDVLNNVTGEHVVMVKDAGGAWSISNATNSTDRATDQAKVTEALGSLAGLQSNSRFTAGDVENFRLASYGLDKPTYTLTLVAADGAAYVFRVGSKNPDSTRYYMLAETGSASEIAPEITPESTVEATAEATAEGAVESTAEPTEEATVEATAEATPEVTAETTAEPTPEATQEATAESTTEATAEATENVAPGTTVYLVSRTEVDNLIRLIAEPPYVPPPTSTPTLFPTPNPFSEVQQTATAAVQQTATQQALEATAEVTAENTAEATPQATEGS